MAKKPLRKKTAKKAPAKAKKGAVKKVKAKKMLQKKRPVKKIVKKAIPKKPLRKKIPPKKAVTKAPKKTPAPDKAAPKPAVLLQKKTPEPSTAGSKPPELLSPPQVQLLLPGPSQPAALKEPKKDEMKIEPIMPEEKKPERPKEEPPKAPQRPVPFQAHENRGGALAVEIEPALDQLPAWEDRIRLRRIIFEDGLKFQELSRSSPDFGQAFNILLKTGRRGYRDVPGYFMICTRDRDGRIIGAMDGHYVGDVLVIGRSAAGGTKRRDLHILMYAAAMSGRNLKFVAFAADKKPLDFSYSGELILLGRGFGMSALSLDKIIFLRRMKKELDPLSSGSEISSVLSSMVPFLPSLGQASTEYASKGAVALVPLPTSPDSREHLHELRDAAESLGIRSEKMDELVSELKSRYVLGREDVTPDLL